MKTLCVVLTENEARNWAKRGYKFKKVRNRVDGMIEYHVYT